MEHILNEYRRRAGEKAHAHLTTALEGCVARPTGTGHLDVVSFVLETYRQILVDNWRVLADHSSADMNVDQMLDEAVKKLMETFFNSPLSPGSAPLSLEQHFAIFAFTFEEEGLSELPKPNQFYSRLNQKMREAVMQPAPFHGRACYREACGEHFLKKLNEVSYTKEFAKLKTYVKIVDGALGGTVPASTEPNLLLFRGMTAGGAQAMLAKWGIDVVSDPIPTWTNGNHTDRLGGDVVRTYEQPHLVSSFTSDTRVALQDNFSGEGGLIFVLEVNDAGGAPVNREFPSPAYPVSTFSAIPSEAEYLLKAQEFEVVGLHKYITPAGGNHVAVAVIRAVKKADSSFHGLLNMMLSSTKPIN